MLCPVAAKKLKAGQGLVATIDYTGTLNDGTVFDSTLGHEPISFVIGDGSKLKSFEEALIGMQAGDSKKIKIPTDYAFGLAKIDKLIELPLSKMDPKAAPRLGMSLKMESTQGKIPVRIVDITPKSLIVDANHVLAGKDLNFDIKLISVAKPEKAAK